MSIMIGIVGLLAVTWFAPPIERDTVYSNVAGESLKIDVYQPAGVGGTKLPGVLVIHGGAWVAGSRKEMEGMTELLAQKGFVAFNVQYRLAPKHKWPAMLDDVQTAVRWIRTNANKYFVDDKRIGALGASAGGHMALMLALRDTANPSPTEYPGISSRVKVVIDFFGPTDLAAPDFPKLLDALVPVVLGKPKAEAGPEIKAGSPMTYVTEKTVPIFIFHGDSDTIVPISQSKALEAKLNALGSTVEAHYLSGEGHTINLKNPEVLKALDSMVEFLKKNL